MSKRWGYVYPDEEGKVCEAVYTEDEIIEKFWDYWKGKMIEAGLKDKITRESCIEDWIITNWAYEVKV